MDFPVATLFNQRIPRIRMDRPEATFVRSFRQCALFQLDSWAAVNGGASAFSIRTMFLDEFEILDLSWVLKISPNRESAKNGGRL